MLLKIAHRQRLDGIRLAPLQGQEGSSMKTIVSVLTAALVSIALAATVSAQTTPTTRTEPQRQVWTPEATAMEASRLVGMKVKTDQGKEVGEVSQLIVDHGSGRITHVVLGRGGVLGMGEQKIALPWSDVKIQREIDRNRLVAVVEQSKLDSAPRYEARRDTAPAASPATR
jgi:sporulation protein YlmC with PRC-barrel domain